MFCPCGSSDLFTHCCQPYIRQEKPPKTSEQLMRSRFSAYAVKNAQYIFETYGKLQQKKQSISAIQHWADECAWIALVVHEHIASVQGHDNVDSIVEFSAFFVVNDTLCEMRERSNFVFDTLDNKTPWRYTDGDIKINKELSRVKRNGICPCNQYPSKWSAKNMKKFKHCCGK